MAAPDLEVDDRAAPTTFSVGGNDIMKPSAEQLTRLKAFYEAKVFSEVEMNALKEKVQDGKGVFLVLDARPREAFLAGHIRTALSVPLAEAAEAAKRLPPDRQYVTYCWSKT